jgi:hypothetical protein
MKRSLCILALLLTASALSGCTGDQEIERGPKGQSEQQVRGGPRFTLDQVVAQMEKQKIENLIIIPREQQAATRTSDDPVEIASASINPYAGAESVSVGLYYTSEDAASAHKDIEGRVAQMQRDKRKLFKLVLACNAIVTYDPGNDLRDLQLDDQAQTLADALVDACKDPDKHPLPEPEKSSS